MDASFALANEAGTLGKLSTKSLPPRRVGTKSTCFLSVPTHARSRRGAKKAIGAVAASILTAAYHMLKDGTLYQDFGADHFDNRAKGKHILRLVNRLHNLGYDVQITPLAA